MQWIKVFTDIFANPKMQLLLKERDGDTFFRIVIRENHMLCMWFRKAFSVEQSNRKKYLLVI